MSKRALEKEYHLLIEHEHKLREKHSAEKTAALEYTEKFQEMERLKNENHQLQQKVVDLRCDVLWSRSARDSRKNVWKDDAKLQAKNKMLRKEIEKLQKELKKLYIVEEEYKFFREDMEGLQEEHCSLRDEIQELNKDIMNKKMLKVRLEALKAEQKLTLEINRDLKKQISWWKGVQWEQLPLREEKEEMEYENEQMKKWNRRLRREMEQEFVRANDCEVQERRTRALNTQHEEMERLNQELKKNMKQFSDP